MLKTSSTRNFTRGGQTLLHVLRMMSQIINRVAMICIIFFLVYVLLVGYFRITPHDKYVLGQLGAAKILVFFDSNSKQQFKLKNGEEITIYSKDLCGSVLVNNVIKRTSRTLIYVIIQGFAFTILFFYIIYMCLYYRGKKQGETQHIRGDEFQDTKTVAGMIQKQGASNIKISDLPMPKDFECGHVLLHGTTGTGKSVCIKELLDQIRARGEKVIIYDKGCDFTKYYYQKTDILLNPLDDRTVSWHLWDECRDDADYDSLAAALIPMPTGNTDPFWTNAARTIFATVARRMKNYPDRSLSWFLDLMFSDDLTALGSFLKGTEAASLVSDKIEKTALSIKSVLITYLKSLKYVKEVKDEEEAFSIRRWIRDDKQTNWLFISSLADKHESLKPLISMWLDLAANSLMSLTPSRSRRIWIILDELPSLHKLPYLTEAFAESRKFGGCLVVGMQSISQLKKIYGQNAAEEISSLCGTRIFFREPSAETAKWVAKELGNAEIEEVQEGISYSESAMRSGITMGKNQLKRELVHPSDIMKLQNLEAYIRLLGDLPITKIKLETKDRKGLVSPYIPRKFDAASAEAMVRKDQEVEADINAKEKLSEGVENQKSEGEASKRDVSDKDYAACVSDVGKFD